MEILQIALETNTPMVIGTTGLNEEQQKKQKETNLQKNIDN